MPSLATLELMSGRGFQTTHWVTVRAAATASGAAAREELCCKYWYPIYAYLRRSGYADAEDITQDFLADILRRNWLVQANPDRGKFRSFLLTSLDYFVHNLADRRKALKRGGHYRRIPVEMINAESRYANGRAASVPPAEVYELEWASAISTAALSRLKREYSDAGKQGHFLALQIFLREAGDAARYQTLAAELGVPTNTAKSLVHRLRRQYGDFLREEVAKTVATPDEVDGEMQHLRATLSAKQLVG